MELKYCVCVNAMILRLLYALILSNIFYVGAFEKGYKNVSSRLYRKSGIGRWLYGKVFYDVDPYLTKDALIALKYALNYMNSLTCVKWIQRLPWDDYTSNYVSFRRYMDTKERQVCRSRFERDRGKQLISIGDWCFVFRDDLGRKTTLLHEMMHAMGFLHEMQRSDRDCYINISEKYKTNFNYGKKDPDEFEHDTPYDYESVMQYESRGRRHMYSYENKTLGRSDGKLSPIDIIQVNHVYCHKPSYCALYPKICEYHKQWKLRTKCVV